MTLLSTREDAGHRLADRLASVDDGALDAPAGPALGPGPGLATDGPGTDGPAADAWMEAERSPMMSTS